MRSDSNHVDLVFEYFPGCVDAARSLISRPLRIESLMHPAFHVEDVHWICERAIAWLKSNNVVRQNLVAMHNGAPIACPFYWGDGATVFRDSFGGYSNAVECIIACYSNLTGYLNQIGGVPGDVLSVEMRNDDVLYGQITGVDVVELFLQETKARVHHAHRELASQSMRQLVDSAQLDAALCDRLTTIYGVAKQHWILRDNAPGLAPGIAVGEKKSRAGGRPKGSGDKLSKDEKEAIADYIRVPKLKSIDAKMLARAGAKRGNGDEWREGTAKLVIKAAKGRGEIEQEKRQKT